MDKEQSIDIFELFAVLFTFSDGLFEKKLKELFLLFDFDGSGDIDFSEIYLALQSTLQGFCKLLGFPPPVALSIKTLASKAMIATEGTDNETYWNLLILLS